MEIVMRLFLAAAAAVCLAGPALAQSDAASDAVSTAPPAPAAADATPTATASAKDTDALIAEWLKDPAAAQKAAQVGGLEPLAPPDKAIHGEVGVAVGNHGYREAYGVANIPLGDKAAATVAIDQAQGRIWNHDVRNTSFGLNLAFGDGARRAPPQGLDCEGLMSGRRYVEPPWVTEMRLQRPGGLAAACPGAALPPG